MYILCAFKCNSGYNTYTYISQLSCMHQAYSLQTCIDICMDMIIVGTSFYVDGTSLERLGQSKTFRLESLGSTFLCKSQVG